MVEADACSSKDTVDVDAQNLHAAIDPFDGDGEIEASRELAARTFLLSMSQASTLQSDSLDIDEEDAQVQLSARQHFDMYEDDDVLTLDECAKPRGRKTRAQKYSFYALDTTGTSNSAAVKRRVPERFLQQLPHQDGNQNRRKVWHLGLVLFGALFLGCFVLASRQLLPGKSITSTKNLISGDLPCDDFCASIASPWSYRCASFSSC